MEKTETLLEVNCEYQKKSITRLDYIDNLRILLTFLVINTHVSITYGASGGWYFVSPTKIEGVLQIILSLINGVNQSFFMSMFFFIAALFIPKSFDNKGFKDFIKDKLIRLGIPLLIFTILIQANLVYIIYGKGNDYWNFVTNQLLHNTHTGPLWFVFALLLFSIVYGLYRLKNDTKNRNYKIQKIKWFHIFGFIVFSASITIFWRLFLPINKSFLGLNLGYFPLYIITFIIGLQVARTKILDRIEEFKLKPWLIFAIINLILLVLIFSTIKGKTESENLNGGLNFQAISYATWDAMMCCTMFFILFIVFKRKMNFSTKILKEMANSSYLVYFVHAIVVITLTLGLEKTNIYPSIKYVLLLVSSIFLSYIISILLRRNSVIRKVF